MPAKPLDITLEIAPKARFDVVDLRSDFAAEHDALTPYRHCLYWSFHTTAGFLDRSLAARLRAQHIPTYVDAVRAFFPEGAGYAHDRLERRGDLDSMQRAVEPRNADSPRLGVYAQLAEFVRDAGVPKGRLRVSLDPNERHSALTVNEYETLLMRHDLAEVLRNPLRFVAEKSRHALANPLAVPAKTLGYAKYDMVRVLNRGLDALGLRGSIIEKAMARTLAVPASRFFRMQRSVNLLLSADKDGQPSIVEGTYQSPILVQWQNAPRQTRVLNLSITEIR